jgi:subtilisin family serine protease
MKKGIAVSLTLVGALGLSGIQAATVHPASEQETTQAALVGETVPSGPGLYIVRLSEPALSSYAGGIPGLQATSPRVTGERKVNPRSPASTAYLTHLRSRHASVKAALASRLGRPVETTFEYLAVLNGFATTLSPAEAAEVARIPGVASVSRDVERTLDTDVGPGHIGAPQVWNGTTGAGVATRGEGVVIGVIDSGINSQHPSFAATDGDGYAHTNPYGAGVFNGWCAANPGFCNAKLIAAYGLNPVGGSPEDTDGHGSHTASTAGGNTHTATFNVGPTPYNISIQGVAPRANIVAYKVCDPGCPGSASIAAVNSAILNDEVDVLNYSISGSDSPWTDPVDLAFLDASNAGIFVAASAGNSGPGASTVAKTGPWNATVAASTHNRIIAHTLDVTGPTTPPALQGVAAFPGEGTSIVADLTGPLGYDAANATGCTPFAAGSFAGALALIQRGGCTFDTKVTNAANAGALGVVVFQNVGGPPISMGGLTGTPPAFMVDLADGTALRDYVVANPTATVRINTATAYVQDNSWQDIVGGFSSRGPSQFEILKPDFTAPGVNILAAVAADGGGPVQYGFQQGTSMSSPHGAGAGALLKALHPTWSPAEIRSALATSATGGLLNEDGATPANPFDVGSGLLGLGGAAAVGLVLDETGASYAAANPGLGGDPKTLNQPSLVDYRCTFTCSWTRTVKSVLPAAASYTASFSGPAGMTVTVTPGAFSIPAGGTQVLQFTADVTALPSGAFAFGAVTLTTGSTLPAGPVTSTRLPVVVVPDNPPNIDVAPLSLASTQYPDTTTTQDLTIANIGFETLTWTIQGQVLHDNGPFVTSVGDGPGGSDVSLLQNVSLGMTTLGFGAQPTTAPANRIADDFTVTDPDGWDLGSVVFYAYQTGSSTTSTLTAVNFRIWDGPPNDPGSTVVFGDTTTNRMTETGWTGAYRYAEDAVGTTRPIMYAVGAADVLLAPGTYWMDWQIAGSLASGPWQPPITILGETTTGNALQLLTGGWGSALDTGTGAAQGVPFLVRGRPTPAWLSLSSLDGSNAAGTSTVVTATFDSTGLAPGTYSAELLVSSNDPDAGPGNNTGLVVVPVTLEVEAIPVYTVSVLVNPEFGGTVSGGGPYTLGDTATVTATANLGWVFLHWLHDGAQITTNPYGFEVTGDLTLTAVFAPRVVEEIPTAGTTGLVLLMTLLAGAGVFALRRLA